MSEIDVSLRTGEEPEKKIAIFGDVDPSLTFCAMTLIEFAWDWFHFYFRHLLVDAR